VKVLLFSAVLLASLPMSYSAWGDLCPGGGMTCEYPTWCCNAYTCCDGNYSGCDVNSGTCMDLSELEKAKKNKTLTLKEKPKE
jgi:hypothetical protein